MYRPFRRLGERLRPQQTIVKYTYVARLKKISKDILVFLQSYLNVHQALVLLTLFILISNGLVVRASNNELLYGGDVVPLDPYKIADTVRILSPFMTDIDQDPDAIAVVLEEQINGTFISTNPLIATMPSQSDDPDILATPEPTIPKLTPKRSNDIKYTVEIGDTLSGISKAYNISTDTLRVKNSLKDADSIKPGQVLVIPSANLSDKAIAAADSKKTGVKQASVKTISGAKAGGYGLITPIHHNGVTRRLAGGHAGVDYRANFGSPVYAASSGIILDSEKGWNGGFGINVFISHGSGMTTRYAHLSSYVVNSGQSVSKGQLIGYSGNSGRSTGPHLHFELRIHGVAKDPGTY